MENTEAVVLAFDSKWGIIFFNREMSLISAPITIVV